MPPTPDRRRLARLVLALGLPLTLAGCGSAAQRRLDTTDARSLQSALASVRASARQGDRRAVLTGLGGLRARVDRLGASGALSPEEARALRSGVARALAAARRELPAPRVAPVIAAASPEPSEEPAEGNGRARDLQRRAGRREHRGSGGDGGGKGGD